jgi:hypothetical protein
MKTFVPKQKLILSIIFSIAVITGYAQSTVIPSGSFIVNMGVTPQTYENGIKPFGMLHDLIRNYRVEVKWVINPGKAKDGVDFNYNGTDYKGGSFIIPARYRSTAVNQRIAYWQGLGVIGVTTTSSLTVNVTYNLKYTPRWTFDFQNGDIALGFLDEAGIPTAGYPKKLPEELNTCDDLFVMPHADPTWATHKNMLFWNQTNRGWIWGGCHATSVIENLVNPADATQRMNFLTTDGLILWGDHNDGTPPYSYRYPADAEMQFMGIADEAMQNGSEQVFLPKIASSWRPSTRVAVYDATQQNVPAISPGEAAAIVYGRAFGDITRGKVMYTGGHNINKGNEDAVAAMRSFFNFSYLSVYDKSIDPNIIGPINLVSLNTYTYRATLPVGNNSSNYTYHWTSTCGGTFSTPYDTVTNFTAPSVASCTPCVIYCTITDGCGREYYQAFDITICSSIPPVALDRVMNLINNPDGTPAQKMGEPVPLAGTDEDGYVTQYVLKSLPASGQLFYDNDNNTATADVVITSLPSGELILSPAQMKSLKYDPINGFGSSTSFMYTVIDNANLRDLTPATYTIPVNPPPVAVTKICTPVASNADTTRICAMEATDNGSIVSYTITSLPPVTQCKIFIEGAAAFVGQVLTPAEAANLFYLPNGKYVGYSEIMYTATDNNSATDVTPATLTLQMVNQPPTSFDVSAENIAAPTGTTQYGLPALSAKDDDGSVASYTIMATTPATQGVLYYSNNGTYTQVNNNLSLTPAQAATLKYDPNESFTGIASVLYTSKDNQGLSDNTPDTLSIPVKTAVPSPNGQVLNSWYAGGGWQTVPPLTASGTVTNFVITYVPPITEGKLGPDLNNDGKGDFRIGYDAGKDLPYMLTAAEAANLMFDPEKAYTGNTYFTFTAKNATGTNPADVAVQFLNIYNTLPETNNVINSVALAHTAAATAITNISAFDADWAIKPQDKTKEFIVITSLPKPSTGVLKNGTANVQLWDIITITLADLLTFDPAAGNSDTAVFTYAYMDKCLDIDPTPATFKIPITGPANINPVSIDATMAPVSVKTGVMNLVMPLNGTDADGRVVSYKIMAGMNPTEGTLYLDGVAVAANQVIPVEKGDDLYFVPSGSWAGTTDIKYKSVDDKGAFSFQTYLYIPLVNTPPVASNISIAGYKTNTTGKISPLMATDLEGTISSFKIITLPTLATLQCDLNGTNSYTNVTVNQVLTPAQGERLRVITGSVQGVTSFTYVATDNTAANSAVATYTIPVTSSNTNQSPVSKSITSTGVNANAGPTLITPLSSTDVDGTIVMYTIITVPPAYYGTLYYNISGSVYDSIVIGNKVITPAQAATLKFRPSGIYSGNVSFSYYAKDNDDAGSNFANYTIPVINMDPIAADISNSPVSSNAGPTAINALSATDESAVKNFIIKAVPAANQGTLVLDGTPVTNGQNIPVIYANRLEFDPNPAFSGTASFKYTAQDDMGAIDKTFATVTIPVTNGIPFADEKISQVITNTLGTTAQAIPALTGYDTDGAIASYTILSLPATGVLYVNGIAATVNQVLTPAQAAMLSFDPADNFAGTTSFTFNVKDNNINISGTAIYNIVANVPPTTSNRISAPFNNTTPKTAIPALVGSDDVSIAYFSILTLPDAAAGKLYLNNVEVTSLSQVSNLSAAQISQFSYQPSNKFGGAIFTYTATDNLGIIDVTPAVYIIPLSAAGNNTPLPIYLITFSGKASGLHNVLNWSTSQEVNSKQIEIERSVNGADFSSVGIVSARGNSSSRSDYTYTDMNVKAVNQYYRLKLVDVDGKSTYSNIIVIKRDNQLMTVNRIMPNPFRDKVEIELLAENNNETVLSLYDMNGKLVKTLQVKTTKGINRLLLNDLGGLGSGTYILHIKNNDGEIKAKLLKISF